MTRPAVFVTRRIHEDGLAILREACEVSIGPAERELPRAGLLAALKDCEGLLVSTHTKVDAPLLDAAPRLRVVANFGVGLDHVDVEECSRRGLWVTNTAGSLTETTAELGWALILATTRRIAEGDRQVRAGRWEGVGPLVFLGTELTGKTLGVVGAGRIGQAVARRAPAFGMRVLYTSRTPKPELAGEHRRLDDLLRESDVVILTVQLTPETRHLIGARELGLMKPSAHLVNIARGAVVDEAALAKALLEKRLAGAGLDVYEHEPQVHPDLLRCEAAVLAPHVGSATVETRRRMSLLAAQNCLAALQGRVPPLAVNADVRVSGPAGP